MRARNTLPPEIERDLAAMDAAASGLRPDGGDAVLAELAALLAGDRPTPDPDWARRMDARAAGGFATPAKPRRRRLPSWFGAPALGLAACAVIALVIGLAATRDRVDHSSSAGGGSS